MRTMAEQGYRITGYTHNASATCPNCTPREYRVMFSDTELPKDREGNEVGAIFSTDDTDLTCEKCGERL